MDDSGGGTPDRLSRLAAIVEARAARVQDAQFEQALADAPEFVWPPDPGTAHPSLERHAVAVRQLMAQGRAAVWVPVHPSPRTLFDRSPTAQSMQPAPTALQVELVERPAPYAGSPYRYAWQVAVEHCTNRWVATEDCAVVDGLRP